MPDPTDPNATAARDANVSAASSADETAPHGAGEPRFGPPAGPGEVGVLGPYRVLKQLGKGGMGAVYLAVDTRLDRKLALKVMLPEFASDRDARDRFVREAKAAAKVAHDNVVTVFEADERDGVPYIAMQFLQGYPLDEYLKTKGAPPLAHVIRIGREAALGLSAAHELGLVHRDIKPGNVWLEAPHGRVKVLDFGLAKPIGSEAELTRSGAVVGTPAYMSPEQARGLKVDARSDLFSLGALLYRLCTGRTPFAGPNVMAVLMALGSDDPAPVRELNPNVPEPLAELIHQLLAKKPDQRPQTADEVAKRLRAVLEQLLAPGGPVADVSGSRPVAVHALPVQPPVVVPMYITATPESAFANLTDDDEVADDATQAEPAGPRPPREPKTGGKGVLLAAVGVALVAVAAVAIVLATTGKGKKEPETKGPDAGPQPAVGKPVVRVEPKGGGEWLTLSPPAPAADWSKLWEAHGAQDWRLQDGELFNANSNVGWLGTRAEYTDFEIELEYKFGAKGNTGVFLRAWPHNNPHGGAFVEVQLADDGDFKNPLFRTGAIYGRTEPNPRPASKLREWNTARVTVVGNRVAVTVNGTPCADAEVEFPRAKGVIGLQQLNSPVYFRNVRVRDLTATAASPDRDVAAWVFSIGGAVDVRDATREWRVATAADLPAGKFVVTTIDFQPKAVAAKVSDADLPRLKGPRKLANISFADTRLTDAGVEHLKEMPAVAALGLNRTAVTDAGVKHLTDRVGLIKLWLDDTAITDAGLEHLVGLHNLRELHLTHTKVTKAGVEKIAAALPLCRVEWNGGAIDPKK